MLKKKKLKLKKFSFHPITTFILLILAVMLASSLLSLLNVQANYSHVNSSNELESTIVAVEGLFNFEGFRFLISNALENFSSFAPLITLLIALIGLSVAYASGFIDAFIKRITSKISNKQLTFFIILLATLSSIINEVGYVILIPFAALIFLANGRNPLLGITASFCGVAFGYGVSFFAGSAEINLVPITTEASYVIDSTYHVSMLSNWFAMIISSIIVSIVGTYVIENIISKKIGKYHVVEDDNESETKEIKLEDVELEQQKRLEEDVKQKRGLRYSLITFIVFFVLVAYMIIPGLPGSGLLLDMDYNAYINRLFGDSSYFQKGFTYLISVMFLLLGIAYSLGAKTIKNDKEMVEKSSLYLKDVGYVIALVFFASQFIAIFKKTNIGMVIVASIANVIKGLEFTGLPLIITVVILIAISSFFVTTQTVKWTVLAPSVVPLLMQANVAPQFSQFIFRVGDSMTKGFTPLLAYFAIYLGYLNIYNTEKEPITIKKALSFVYPYCLIISITWIIIVSLIYIVGIPIGPGVYPTL